MQSDFRHYFDITVQPYIYKDGREFKEHSDSMESLVPWTYRLNTPMSPYRAKFAYWSTAYVTRYIVPNIVDAGFAKKCKPQFKTENTMIWVGYVNNSRVCADKIVREEWICDELNRMFP